MIFLILAECDQDGRVVAGVKLSPFADSFSACCLGDQRIQKIFGAEAPIDEIVEISKAVNVGGPIAISRLISQTYRWLRRHALHGFVSTGPARNMKLWKQLIECTWQRHWQASVIAISEPEVDIPDHIELSLLYVQNRKHSPLPR